MSDIQDLIQVIKDLPLEIVRQIGSHEAAKEAQVNKREAIKNIRELAQQAEWQKMSNPIGTSATGGGIQYMSTTDTITTTPTTTTDITTMDKIKLYLGMTA